MATTPFWTPELLGDVTTALSISLDRVTAAELGTNTLTASNWSKVQGWLHKAEGILREIDAKSNREHPLEGLPAFPLTGAQLRALHSAVDGVAQVRLANQSLRTGEAPESLARLAGARPMVPLLHRLYRNLNRVQLSSLVLAVILLALVAVNVADIILFHSEALRYVATFNVALSVLAIGAWATHHYHLLHHVQLLHGHHPNLAFHNYGLVHWHRPHLRNHTHPTR